MDKTPRLIPIWLWVSAIIIMVLLCSSCRGGRSLGKGSAGTVIVPQTPQQINERNRQPPPKIVLPPLEPLAPIPIIPPKTTPVAPPVAPPEAVRSTPTLPESKSAEANPVIINPKPAGELKPFSPSVSSTPVNIKMNNNDGIITLDPREENGFPEDKPFINWSKLTYYYLFLFIAMIFGWVVYDIVQTHRLRSALEAKTKKKTIKKPAKGTRASRKKAISKPQPPM